MKILFMLMLFTLLSAKLINHQLHSKCSLPFKEKAINFLDAKELHFDKNFNELSGIAYNNGKLYGVSDKGYIYYMSIEIQNNLIKSLFLDKTIKLQSKQKNKKIDSEDIIFVDNSFYISFEGKSKIQKYSIDAIPLEIQKLHKKLRNQKNFQGKNKGLESLVYSKKYGIITAPQEPLKNETNSMHALYAKNKIWYFPYKAPLSSMVFMGKNKLLLLQRDYNRKKDSAKIYLTQVNLKKCVNGVCKSKILATLKTKDGWRVDNFEGLTKVDEKRFLMISDNNNNPTQKTLLVLFEVLD